MSAHAEEPVADLLRRTARARGIAPLSPQQAQAAYDSAQPETLADRDIARIVRRVTAGKPYRARTRTVNPPLSEETVVNEEMLVLNRNPGENDPDALKAVEDLRREALADDREEEDDDDDDEVRSDPR
jgi:hypothetical protein